MIKLAFAINVIRNGGPSNVVRTIVDRLDRTKFEVVLITFFKDENDRNVVNELKSKSVTVIEWNYHSRMKCMVEAVGHLSAVLEKYNIDVLHTHGYIPDILSARCESNVKKISTIHCNIFEDYPETYGKLKSFIYIPTHLYFLRKLDCQVCCSKTVYSALSKYLNRCRYIRNGIDGAKVKKPVTREKLGLQNDDVVYIYVGRLSVRKNIVWLIHNFVKNRKTNEYLLVLGKGEKELECKAVADDHVKMLGFQSDPAAYMQISDIYVSASKSEGFSISVLEALASGLGLFLSDIPSHKEVIGMSDGIPLGKVFTANSFSEELNELRAFKFNRQNIITFQKQHLSAKGMSHEYELQYMYMVKSK